MAEKKGSMQNFGVKYIGTIQCVDDLPVTSSSLGSDILSVPYFQAP
jgi:hypothetical protein